ncbi:glycosyltransferase [Ornithinimicrobium cerasi]|uniref:glycosyltransferase n=1 Tax=Ornithinimicrobium cerasi TaxID=2248773 RepID=UPI0011427302|nr:glycosyltransferase [Ornithinimicrobium cerasi]
MTDGTPGPGAAPDPGVAADPGTAADPGVAAGRTDGTAAAGSAGPPLLHVVPGPEAHGVVRHGLLVHDALAADLLRCDRLDALPDGALAGRSVVVQVTDRVLAGDPDAGLVTWRRVLRGAVRVSVVLHDLPQASDGRWRRARSTLYATVAAESDEVVVASHHERLLLAAALRWARPASARQVLARVHVIPLPVERSAPAAEPTSPGTSVVTLGYVYPGKGLEEVVDAAAAAARDPRLAGRAVEVRNLGRASDGHDDLVEALTARAAAAGVSWSTTGWVDDEDLPGLLAGAGVPVAAHQHLSASGSIATWLAAGRRPVVLRSRYAQELADRMPGALTLVDPGRLAEAVADALADPAMTRLDPSVRLGPSAAEAGRLLGEVARGPAVSVVVPYYRDQELLDLILRRLDAQTGVVGGLEVVVADDGSPEPPDVSACALPVRVVRQEDLGFRAGAARNLGARRARGRVLLFVDGDTVPEDGYAAALQRVCLASPALAAGRRRHADLRAVARGGGRPWPPVEPLAEPGWLADGFAASDDLRAADDGSFRYVLSAVMAVPRVVWEVVGGFDEGLTGYGGEDWDLAWRTWLAGADLRHVPGAVAWHDGPDLAGRPEGQEAERLARVKNGETSRLAPRLPHPLVRGRGWVHEQPDVVVVLRAGGWTPGQVEVVTESVLRLGDVGVWLDGVGEEEDGPAGLLRAAGGGRVHLGLPPPPVLGRARACVEVTRPVVVLRLPWAPYPHDLTGTVDGTGSADGAGSVLVADDASGVRVVATRSRGRRLLHGEPLPAAWLPEGWVEPVDGHVVVERWRQAHP